MNFKKSKVLHLRDSHSMPQYGLGVSNFAGKDWGDTLESRFNMSQQCAISTKRDGHILGSVNKSTANRSAALPFAHNLVRPHLQWYLQFEIYKGEPRGGQPRWSGGWSTQHMRKGWDLLRGNYCYSWLQLHEEKGIDETFFSELHKIRKQTCCNILVLIICQGKRIIPRVVKYWHRWQRGAIPIGITFEHTQNLIGHSSEQAGVVWCCFEQQVGLDDLVRSLSAKIITWFCNSRWAQWLAFVF